MNEEQEMVWDRLKYGIDPITAVMFYGDGCTTHFTSIWLGGFRLCRILVDDVAQSNFRDFRIQGNVIAFKKPPSSGQKIVVEIFDR